MSWERNWEEDAKVDEMIDNASKAEQQGQLDDEGYRLLGLRERLYRSLAMIIFVLVFPFVFVFLAIYRGASMLSFKRQPESKLE